MSICSKCASLGTTCCIEPEIFLTQGDLKRIQKFIGHADFVEYRRLDPAYLFQMAQDDPTWVTYTVRIDGSSRVVKCKPSGECFFLTKTGCALPRDTRPLICRLYPLDFIEQGIRGIKAGQCPEHLLEQGETIIDALGMSYEEAKTWRALLYTELRKEGETVYENRDDLRFATSLS